MTDTEEQPFADRALVEIDLDAIRRRCEAAENEAIQSNTGYPTREVLGDDVPALIAEIEQLRAEHSQPCPWAADYERAVVEINRLSAEIERLRGHSITLNSVGFQLSEALGRVPVGADAVLGNPLKNVGELIEERNRLRILVDILAAEQPGGEEYDAAETKLMEAWPHLAKDRVHVEQLVRVVLDAAWEVNHPRREWKVAVKSHVCHQSGSDSLTQCVACGLPCSWHAEHHEHAAPITGGDFHQLPAAVMSDANGAAMGDRVSVEVVYIVDGTTHQHRLTAAQAGVQLFPDGRGNVVLVDGKDDKGPVVDVLYKRAEMIIRRPVLSDTAAFGRPQSRWGRTDPDHLPQAYCARRAALSELEPHA